MPIYYVAAGAQQGPVHEDEFEAMVAARQAPAETLVWREGMPDWQTWSDFAVATGRQPAPPPAPVPTPVQDAPPGPEAGYEPFNHFPPPEVPATGISAYPTPHPIPVPAPAPAPHAAPVYGQAEAGSAFAPNPAYGVGNNYGMGAGAGPGTVVPSGGAMCVECGRVFPEGEVARFGAQAVCGGCKPLFVQRIREGGGVRGSTMPREIRYAGFGVRWGARFLDGLITGLPVGMVLLLGFGVIAAGVQQTQQGSTQAGQAAMFGMFAMFGLAGLVFFALTLIFEPFMLRRYGGTPGKLITGLRVVTESGGRIGLGTAIGRSLYPMVVSFVPVIGGWVYLGGCVVAGFDEEKRALHDRVFKTRVIYAEDRTIPYTQYPS